MAYEISFGPYGNGYNVWVSLNNGPAYCAFWAESKADCESWIADEQLRAN